MGLFSKLGRQVEEFKQTAKNAAKRTEAVQCPACDEQFDSTHEQCPECGEELAGSTGTKE
jgi:rRNA maturation endonuclease Nob1